MKQGYKCLTVFLGAITVTSIFAQSQFDGFYANAMLGLQSSSFKNVQVVGKSELPLLSGTNSATATISPGSVTMGSQFLGQLAFGYDKSFNRFNLAAQVFLNSAGKHEKNYAKTATTTVTVDEDEFTLESAATGQLETSGLGYGLDLQPGYLINSHSLVYGDLGLGWQSFKLDNTTADGLILQNEDPDPVNVSKSFNALGVRLGLGYQYKFNQHMSVNVSYIHTVFNSEKSITTTRTQVVGADTFRTTATMNAKLVANDTILAGVNYFF